MASAAFTHNLQLVPTAGLLPHALLRLRGEVDCLAADELRQALQQVTTPGRVATVLVDLDGVTFMNCAGLSPLLMAKRQLGERLQFRSLPSCVRRLLSLTHMTPWMDPSASDERADESAMDAYGGEQTELCHATLTRRDGASGAAKAVHRLPLQRHARPRPRRYR